MLFKITKASKPGFNEADKPCKKASILSYETGEKVCISAESVAYLMNKIRNRLGDLRDFVK